MRNYKTFFLLLLCMLMACTGEWHEEESRVEREDERAMEIWRERAKVFGKERKAKKEPEQRAEKMFVEEFDLVLPCVMTPASIDVIITLNGLINEVAGRCGRQLIVREAIQPTIDIVCEHVWSYPAVPGLLLSLEKKAKEICGEKNA